MKDETPFEKKSCYDCAHLKSALSWWCSNEEAIEARGTRIPGCIHCPYWSPEWSMIEKEHRTEANGYKSAYKASALYRLIQHLKYLLS